MGRLGGALEHFVGVLGCLSCVLGASWGVLGELWSILWASWGRRKAPASVVVLLVGVIDRASMNTRIQHCLRRSAVWVISSLNPGQRKEVISSLNLESAEAISSLNLEFCAILLLNSISSLNLLTFREEITWNSFWTPFWTPFWIHYKKAKRVKTNKRKERK